MGRVMKSSGNDMRDDRADEIMESGIRHGDTWGGRSIVRDKGPAVRGTCEVPRLDQPGAVIFGRRNVDLPRSAQGHPVLSGRPERSRKEVGHNGVR